MADQTSTILSFILGIIVSSIIIYVVTRLFGKKESIFKAILTAFIGSIVYTIVYAVLSHGILAAIIGGIAWLLTLKKIYDMGWLKALVIAIIIWIAAAIIGALLPTATGPL